MYHSTKTIISIAVVVFIAAAAFFGGWALGKTHGTMTRGFSMSGQAAGQRGQLAAGMGGAGGMGFGRGGTGTSGGVAAGTILSKDATSVTVKLASGGSRIVLLSPSTPIMKSTTGSAADLTVGANILANGTANSDGSITAQSISIGTMPFGQRPTTAPGATTPTSTSAPAPAANQ